jgi:hypothetical protein
MQRFKKGTSDAEKYAVSFYVKGNASATYVCELYDYDNFRGVSQTFSVTTAWTRVELSFPADTTGALDNDSNVSFAINIYLHAGSNFNSGSLQTTWSGSGYRATGTDNFFDSTSRTLFLTGVQLEVGDNATPFEHLSFGEELALCQRYFYKEVRTSGALFGFVGFADNSTTAYIQHIYPVPMRSEPTLSTTGTTGDYSIRVTGNTLGCSSVPSLSSGNEHVSHVTYSVSSGLTGGQAVIGKFDAADVFLGFDAEL